MDKETRGVIEKALDYVYEEQDFLETVKWILEVDEKVVSEEDLALGYFLGSLVQISWDLVEKEKQLKKYDKRLERKFGKKEARKMIKEREERTKTYNPYRVSLTEE